MYFASFEGEQGNPHQFHPQYLHHPHTGPVGVGGVGGNMTDMNGPMAAINPNYNPDFFWPPLSHHHHVPVVTIKLINFKFIRTFWLNHQRIVIITCFFMTCNNIPSSTQYSK